MGRYGNLGCKLGYPVDCDCNFCRRQRGGNQGGRIVEGGYAFYDGQHVYWDYHRDGKHKINIFPQGPYTRGHDHIIVVGAEIKRIGANDHIVGGREVFRRINGVRVSNQ